MDILFESIKGTLHVIPQLIVIFWALLITELLLELGILKKLEFIGKPLVKLAHLPSESAIAFIISIGSPRAASTMLAGLRQKGIISTKEILLSVLLNGFPTYIKETFTYQFPIIMPALGPKIGLIYLFTFLLCGVVKLIFVIFAGRTFLKPHIFTGVENCQYYQNCAKPVFKNILREAFKKQIKMFSKITMIFILMTFIVLSLVNSGFLNGAKKYIRPVTKIMNLPEESIVPITTFAVSPLAGAGGLGALCQSKIVTQKQGIIIALLGGLLLSPVFQLRYSLAYYISIFGFRLGIMVLAISTAIGMSVRGAVLLFFLCTG